MSKKYFCEDCDRTVTANRLVPNLGEWVVFIVFGAIIPPLGLIYFIILLLKLLFPVKKCPICKNRLTRKDKI